MYVYVFRPTSPACKIRASRVTTVPERGEEHFPPYPPPRKAAITVVGKVYRVQCCIRFTLLPT